MGQEQRGVGQFLRVSEALQQVHSSAGFVLLFVLIKAGHHGAGCQAIDPRGRIVLRHGEHRHAGGEGLLGHGIAEEIRVRIEQLLIKKLDNPLAALGAGLGQECLGHPGGGFRIDCDGFGKDTRIDRGAIIVTEHGGAIDQHAPIVEPTRDIRDHVQGGIAIEEVALDHFGRG